MGRSSSSNSSSGEEDGDADWRAAIDSVATNSAVSGANGFTKSKDSVTNDSGSRKTDEQDQENKFESHGFKLYQIKAQKLLDDLLAKSLVMVRNPIPNLDERLQQNENGIRLFSQAPPGIIFDIIDALPQPKKRPRILPGEEMGEKSKKFKRRLQSVAVDGMDIMTAAKDACQRSLSRFETKDVAKKAAAKREEERVADLKRLRGEKWIPSIAREMQVSFKNRVVN